MVKKSKENTNPKWPRERDRNWKRTNTQMIHDMRQKKERATKQLDLFAYEPIFSLYLSVSLDQSDSAVRWTHSNFDSFEKWIKPKSIYYKVEHFFTYVLFTWWIRTAFVIRKRFLCRTLVIRLFFFFFIQRSVESFNGHLTMKTRIQTDAIVSTRQTYRQPNKVILFKVDER